VEGYRIANFVLQLAYLLAHVVFTVKILRVRRDTPVWTWFFLFSVSMWLWVSGRFAESVVYLFLPADNAAYVFAANYQYIGITLAAVAYLIWSLYLAGRDALAGSRALRAILCLYPMAVCGLVFTNGRHHLFYTKLIMGEPVAHGPLFGAAMFTGYLLMFVGYFISMLDIIRKREQVARRLLLFSTFPFLPAIAVAVRSFSGIDRFDYTPVVMGAAFVCLYLMVFKYNDAGIIPASMKEAVEQTGHPIWIYDPAKKEYSYENRSAREQYANALDPLLPDIPQKRFFERGALLVSAMPLPGSGEVLVTAADLSELSGQIRQLENTVAELERVSRALDEENRNIDAYLDTLQNTDAVQRQKTMLDEVYGQIADSFLTLNANLQAALEEPENDAPLKENMLAAEQCMAVIRSAVARLREG